MYMWHRCKTAFSSLAKNCVGKNPHFLRITVILPTKYRSLWRSFQVTQFSVWLQARLFWSSMHFKSSSFFLFPHYRPGILCCSSRFADVLENIFLDFLCGMDALVAKECTFDVDAFESFIISCHVIDAMSARLHDFIKSFHWDYLFCMGWNIS